MEKLYRVRGVRRQRCSWGECVRATIYLDNRQIGELKDCPDSGKPTFEFPLQTDRIVFESFINQWWTGIKPMEHYHANGLELASQFQTYSPSMPEKMRYWITASITAAEADRMKLAA